MENKMYYTQRAKRGQTFGTGIATSTGYLTTAVATLYDGYGAEIHVTNVNANTTMYYKIDRYLSADGTAKVIEMATERALDPSTFVLDSTTVVLPFDKLVVSVRHSTTVGLMQFQIDAKSY